MGDYGNSTFKIIEVSSRYSIMHKNVTLRRVVTSTALGIKSSSLEGDIRRTEVKELQPVGNPSGG